MRGFTRAALWMVGIFGAIALLLYLFLFDYWRVPGTDKELTASVLPTLVPEDLILVQRGRRPKYGELARCLSPVSSTTFVVGRMFGGPGDRVDVGGDGAVTTNGQRLAARHGCPAVTMQHPVSENLVTMSCGVAETGAWSFSYLTSSSLSGGTHSAVVEAGKVYLVSDNRVMHQDSRDFGLVDESTCEHIVYRLWGERFTDASRRFTLIW